MDLRRDGKGMTCKAPKQANDEFKDGVYAAMSQIADLFVIKAKSAGDPESKRFWTNMAVNLRGKNMRANVLMHARKERDAQRLQDVKPGECGDELVGLE